MPPIAPDAMTGAQREAAREISAGRRGAVYGPFVPALRSPELTRRLQALGEYLRYDSSLPARLREFVILLVAREWTQDFEWDVHAPAALEAGVTGSTVAAIAEGRRPEAMPDDEAVLWEFVLEVQRTHGVSDRTYSRGVAAFGEQGVIDLLGTLGYYTTLAMIMNVARTPLPEGRSRVLSRFPG
jgi:4-carboxymuconolactone decarboxylase